MCSLLPERARGTLSKGYTCASRKARIAMLALALAGDLTAQPAAGTGTVTGRVQNVTNGMYLNNARVSVEGTNKEVFTNEYGEFMLTDVPAGEVKLRVVFTGMDPQVVTVNVPAGQIAEQDVRIGSSRLSAASHDGDTVVLDQFVVSSQRETNAQAIAANEQRFAPNIKVVVAADAFGDVTEGNIGEFVKYLPGITVDYVAADVRTMSVRGFADNFTAVHADGVRLASASSGAAQRSFEFEQVSINNVARVEVTKVPTPEFSADTLGGSLNMISKTAFERDRAQFKFRGYVSVNDENLIFWKKTPGPMGKETYKVLPGFDFDLTLPINKKFGLVVTGLTSNQFNEQHRSQNTWNFAQAGATRTNPYMQNYTIQDGPKNSFRDSLSVRADWKPAPGHTVFATYQVNYYKSQFGNRNLSWDVGTTDIPQGGGVPLEFSKAEYTSGASGRGSVRHGTSFRDKMGATNAGQVGWRFNGRLWDVDGGAHASTSRSWYRDTGRGHFDQIRADLTGLSRVEFRNIREPRPEIINAYDAAGNLLNPYIAANYRLVNVNSRPIDAIDEYSGVYLNIKRDLDFLPVNASIKFGGVFRRQERDMERPVYTWNYVGADGRANSADDNAAQFHDTEYGPYPYWGFQHIQWLDVYKMYDAFVANPTHFSYQELASERTRYQNSQAVMEDTTGLYVQGEVKLLNNKLTLVGGVRYEKTEDTGYGLLTNGPANDMPTLRANWKLRGLKAESTYDGYYPSLHTTYNITDDLLVRVAWAKTYGRPDFSNILPLARVNDTQQIENDGIGDIPPETIISTNPALLPWSAHNYDISLEYYMPRGGSVSVGVFRKDLEDFWGNDSGPATAQDIAVLNLSPSYVGFDLRTTRNVGKARISGAEFSWNQPLNFMSGWIRHFSVFANATKLRLEGERSADFSRFIEESASWGVTYSRSPLVVMLKWNYRGRQDLGTLTGAGFGGAASNYHGYLIDRVNLDVNVEYTLSKRFALFANARNIMNVPQTRERYDDVTPDYARFFQKEQYGVQIAAGVKGTF
jgi:iron complex outermembrane recepter protein